MMPKYEFALYISGETPASRRTLATVKEFMASCSQLCSVKIIDVLDTPETAQKKGIFATPTLVKIAPKPQKTIVGEVADVQSLMLDLKISELS